MIIKENTLSTCAIITSFNADSNFNERIERISKQVNTVVIVDNHSELIALSQLKEIIKIKRGIHIIYNSMNLGVAKALNQGVLWAKKNNFDFVLLLDQDSIVDETMLETLHYYYLNNNEKNIGMVGSNYSCIDNNIPMFHNKTPMSSNYSLVKSIITSGSLIPLQVFDKVGLFQDELFIDFIDIEFCLRIRSYGYKILLVTTSLMQHSIGSATTHNLPWKKTSTTNHIPIRRYYMMRNNIIVAKKYFLKYPLWSVKSILNSMKSVLLMLLFERNRTAKFKFTILGLLDGVTGRYKKNIG